MTKSGDIAVTVLMPVYNAEQFLAEAMESILFQTFTDFEFLIIDDGSTDISVPIVRSYNDPRIRLVRNDTNLGISPTLNRGIALARSPLIARMDADDISHPQRLEKQYRYMVDNPDCALLSTWVRVVDADRVLIREEKFYARYLYYNLTFECCIYHPTVMLRREAVNAVGGYRMSYSEDFDLFWQLSLHYRIHGLDEPLLDYRITSYSTHNVLKKKEYEEAHRENMIRHIRYYIGKEEPIEDKFLEAFRYELDGLLKENSLRSLTSCIRMLDRINQEILKQENVNRDPQNLAYISRFKRDYLLTILANKLIFPRAILLLLVTGSGRLLFNQLKKRVFALGTPLNP